MRSLQRTTVGFLVRRMLLPSAMATFNLATPSFPALTERDRRQARKSASSKNQQTPKAATTTKLTGQCITYAKRQMEIGTAPSPRPELLPGWPSEQVRLPTPSRVTNDRTAQWIKFPVRGSGPISCCTGFALYSSASLKQRSLWTQGLFRTPPASAHPTCAPTSSRSPLTSLLSLSLALISSCTQRWSMHASE